MLVYQLDSYDYWRRQLGREDFEYGQFGENFTVEGLADDEVCIGDRYGSVTALFEVTPAAGHLLPRRPAARRAALPALLVAHRRPGFYLRVLREGGGRGRRPDRQGRDGPGADDRRRGRRAAVPARPRPRRHRARAAHPGAEPGWRGPSRLAGQRRLRRPATPGSTRPQPNHPRRGRGSGRLRVVEVVRETATVVSLHLAAPDGRRCRAALPGQFVALRLDLGRPQPPLPAATPSPARRGRRATGSA